MGGEWLPALVLAACFGQPQLVTIDGYAGHAMEPFIARDGSALFFNSRNGPGDQTDIFWASRVDDLHFRYRGPVAGANSAQLDGVPSLARDGAFAFISTRAVAQQHATIWTGHWDGSAVSALQLEQTLSPGRLPRFNMDAELSTDGARLYFTDNDWAPIIPRTSDLHLAVREDGRWRRAPEHDSWFGRVNTRDALEYAPATSPDELELYFTRLTRRFLQPPRLEIPVATRPLATAPFSIPERIGALNGFIEAPSVAPDGALYFHAQIGDTLRILRTARACA